MQTEHWLAALAGVVWLFYLYHAVKSADWWWHNRDGRSLRQFFLALMLLVGTSLIMLGALTIAWPQGPWRTLIVGLRPVLYGMLLVGGMVVTWTWRADG